jgi:2-desacetyl-2-hydroxyethyl bacteriochlorophyllide A dehydrogenase
MHILGIDVSVLHNQIAALVWNILDWAISFIPHLKKKRIDDTHSNHKCIVIRGPGGFNQLQQSELKDDCVTVGYNIQGFKSPFATITDFNQLDPTLVIINIHYFSVNYADIAIRWGLYESALRYVGWPIVPGFDSAGAIEWAGKDSGFVKGDKVFGFTLFGAYSSKLLVPSRQIRKMPSMLKLEEAAALPAVAATALHSIALSGGWPNSPISTNKAVLIHSAAGGVGSLLIQMCKIIGYTPIVAVVGSPHKIEFCRRLGAQIVIDKSKLNGRKLWQAIEKACPSGFTAIFDANGVSTLKESYNHLAQ